MRKTKGEKAGRNTNKIERKKGSFWYFHNLDVDVIMFYFFRSIQHFSEYLAGIQSTINKDGGYFSTRWKPKGYLALNCLSCRRSKSTALGYLTFFSPFMFTGLSRIFPSPSPFQPSQSVGGPNDYLQADKLVSSNVRLEQRLEPTAVGGLVIKLTLLTTWLRAPLNKEIIHLQLVHHPTQPRWHIQVIVTNKNTHIHTPTHLWA